MRIWLLYSMQVMVSIPAELMLQSIFIAKPITMVPTLPCGKAMHVIGLVEAPN